MNVFTTDHPMMSQTSWFDAKEHPRLSFICSVAVLALALSPFVLFWFCDYVVNDGDNTTPEAAPEGWCVLTLGSLLAYAIGLVCAAPVVWIYRVVMWKTSRLRLGRKKTTVAMARNFAVD
jgi:hypothetical protein